MSVLLCREIKLHRLQSLLDHYGISVSTINDNDPIPGSFWQPPEAGLIKDTLYIRDDTPVHSALHETCHYICMDDRRRENLNTDAGGNALEESGVCYLSIVLSDFIPEMKQKRMLQDMDEWGYSYRLGSAQAWFERDAEDAFEWLLLSKLIDRERQPTWNLRH